jgi:membrane protein implicated in regulation of membrane protease activity
VGEMTTPGSFFLAPFALGAGLAAALAFVGVDLVIQWAVFLGVSVVAFAALRPLARRLDQQGHVDGVGSRRLIGATGFVVDPIEIGGSGLVKIGSEEWRAVADDDQVIAAGARVQISDVRGTKVVVRQVGGDA